MQDVGYAKVSIDAHMTVLVLRQQESEDFEINKFKFCLAQKQLEEV